VGRRWSRRSKVLLALGAICGMTAFVMVRGYAAHIAAMDPGSPVSVVVAARDLAAGSRVVPEALTVDTIPSAYAPPEAYGDVRDAVGGTLRADIAAGEILTRSRVGDSGPVAALVPAGLRGFALQTSLPPGSVAAGDRIDVLATYTQAQPYTEVAGEGLEILRVLPAASAGYAADAPRGPTLVLLVDPAGAERLSHALASAKLTVDVVGATEAPASPMPP
jgi:Flp pilus assembly protein CpaB